MKRLVNLISVISLEKSVLLLNCDEMLQQLPEVNERLFIQIQRRLIAQ